MRTATLAATILVGSFVVQDGSAQLLQVVREPINVGAEAAYAAVETETASACVELRCPHPHLALEPVAGPREIWWFNLFASEANRQRVIDEYSRNGRLMEVLQRNSRRKAAFTGVLVDTLFGYRRDLSRGVALDLTAARFVVVAPASDAIDGTVALDGPVFEAEDGTRLVVRPAKTQDEAKRLHTRGGPGTTLLAVLPAWGMPAKDWIVADPDFWAPNPMRRP
jgi:hypothetical protein